MLSFLSCFSYLGSRFRLFCESVTETAFHELNSKVSRNSSWSFGEEWGWKLEEIKWQLWSAVVGGVREMSEEGEAAGILSAIYFSPLVVVTPPKPGHKARQIPHHAKLGFRARVVNRRTSLAPPRRLFQIFCGRTEARENKAVAREMAASAVFRGILWGGLRSRI